MPLAAPRNSFSVVMMDSLQGEVPMRSSTVGRLIVIGAILAGLNDEKISPLGAGTVYKSADPTGQHGNPG